MPELCAAHLATMIEPWARTRAQGSTAQQWIDWAARRACDAEESLKALGLIRPSRALDQGRPVISNAPERR